MRSDDLDAALAIERSSFVTPWSRQAFVHELTRNRVAQCWVARGDAGEPALLGYLCLWAVVDEVHVTNLAVHPDWRRRGVGSTLLAHGLAHARALGGRRAFLEVRPANAEARRLYARFGFREVGVRKGYYFDTGEDALVLEADLEAWNPPRA
jgi:ribosomal-protein-alanine N-acetyltransferase